jgi:protein-disulfide isomerase
MRQISACAAILFVLLCVFSARLPMRAADWETLSDLPGVDLSKLTPAQKEAALKMLRETGCTCGCNMKLAQCRVVDPNCSYSKGLAALIVRSFGEGKSPDEVAKIVVSSPLGHPRPQPKVLEDPVQIPTAGAPELGPQTARVTIVEFSDFECPYCAKAGGEIRHIMAAYPNDLRLIYKQFPLSVHPHAEMAAMAALGAQEQGKFWQMHDKMFANFHQITRENLLAWANELGLDVPKFTAALDSPKNKAIVAKDLEDGEFAGVNGTPALFIDGKHYNGPVDLAVLKPILDEEIKNAHPPSRP